MWQGLPNSSAAVSTAALNAPHLEDKVLLKSARHWDRYHLQFVNSIYKMVALPRDELGVVFGYLTGPDLAVAEVSSSSSSNSVIPGRWRLSRRSPSFALQFVLISLQLVCKAWRDNIAIGGSSLWMQACYRSYRQWAREPSSIISDLSLREDAANTSAPAASAVAKQIFARRQLLKLLCDRLVRAAACDPVSRLFILRKAYALGVESLQPLADLIESGGVHAGASGSEPPYRKTEQYYARQLMRRANHRRVAAAMCALHMQAEYHEARAETRRSGSPAAASPAAAGRPSATSVPAAPSASSAPTAADDIGLTPSPCMEDGFILLAQWHDPLLTAREIRLELDDIARLVRAEIVRVSNKGSSGNAAAAATLHPPSSSSSVTSSDHASSAAAPMLPNGVSVREALLAVNRVLFSLPQAQAHSPGLDSREGNCNCGGIGGDHDHDGGVNDGAEGGGLGFHPPHMHKQYLQHMSQLHQATDGGNGSAGACQASNLEPAAVPPPQNAEAMLRSTFYRPQNSFIDCVLRHRTGLPIALSCVYEAVCRRIGLQHIKPVGMPGHFLLKHDPPNCRPGPDAGMASLLAAAAGGAGAADPFPAPASTDIYPNTDPSTALPFADDTEVFIDPYHLGAFWTRAQLQLHKVRSSGMMVADAADPRILAVTPLTQVWARAMINLESVFESAGDYESLVEIRSLVIWSNEAFFNATAMASIPDHAVSAAYSALRRSAEESRRVTLRSLGPRAAQLSQLGMGASQGVRICATTDREDIAEVARACSDMCMAEAQGGLAASGASSGPASQHHGGIGMAGVQGAAAAGVASLGMATRIRNGTLAVANDINRKRFEFAKALYQLQQLHGQGVGNGAGGHEVSTSSQSSASTGPQPLSPLPHSHDPPDWIKRAVACLHLLSHPHPVIGSPSRDNMPLGLVTSGAAAVLTSQKSGPEARREGLRQSLFHKVLGVLLGDKVHAARGSSSDGGDDVHSTGTVPSGVAASAAASAGLSTSASIDDVFGDGTDVAAPDADVPSRSASSAASPQPAAQHPPSSMTSTVAAAVVATASGGSGNGSDAALVTNLFLRAIALVAPASQPPSISAPAAASGAAGAPSSSISAPPSTSTADGIVFRRNLGLGADRSVKCQGHGQPYASPNFQVGDIVRLSQHSDYGPCRGVIIAWQRCSCERLPEGSSRFAIQQDEAIEAEVQNGAGPIYHILLHQRNANSLGDDDDGDDDKADEAVSTSSPCLVPAVVAERDLTAATATFSVGDGDDAWDGTHNAIAQATSTTAPPAPADAFSIGGADTAGSAAHADVQLAGIDQEQPGAQEGMSVRVTDAAAGSNSQRHESTGASSADKARGGVPHVSHPELWRYFNEGPVSRRALTEQAEGGGGSRATSHIHRVNDVWRYVPNAEVALQYPDC